jgi:hypothetical protein
MSDTATKLSEARAALHLLVIGKSARVVVDQNGERVEFTAANRAALESYIASLETSTARRPAGPIGFIF